jgi:hypothetical protein
VAYPEDLVGKYIQFNRIGNALSERDKNSHDYVLKGYGANLSVPVSSYRSGNAGGTSQHGAIPVPPRRPQVAGQPHWIISFLDYFPGKVTVAQLAQFPVLTGPMSGCFLFRYNEQGGSTWCAHVGTSETEEVSVEAKRNWKSFAQTRMATHILGQSPFNFFDVPTLRSAAKFAGGPPQIYGLFEPGPDGKFYAILLARIQSGDMAKLVKVHAIRESYLQPWEVIEKGKAFKDIRT